VNPHKWLLTPLDASVLYTSRPEILRRAFSLVPDYLRTAENPRAVNYMEYGVPLGRRFRSLKLWFVFRYFGRSRIAEVIGSHCAMAREFASWVDADEQFERMAPVPLSLVTFRRCGSDEDNQRLLETVNASGEAYLSGTTLNGRSVLRLAIGNAGTTRAHVARAWELIQRCAAAL
jgi:aromatic-L-amino-acid decarboxylase